ncbi:DUF2528 family protein [Pseudomonas aeruginosa]|uniref:DUF2528 family protein n=1 Tax=Pseudomonas aeruginosa TaxID=287 RepID=UPI00071BEFA9|nr:DUF2528 family protein [Pseudomonas aeruginosa]KSQ02022.1 DUF2528 domain-containing protein [Pseudomonas aeruginosa]KSS84078.1 DUF2528 domain-containing protein [Pseudomonas aeruginosa]KSS99606.1 DUF2528 domain-containing protein [Pseudomonas aeruginosa]MDA3250722.1 DUF2528 family protein [Pseudomonas aeruginosa]OFB97631.1 hypothetical protein AN472_32830 [Pseudomonas aeruginosa]
MTTIKRYTVKESWKDYSVTLEVDHSILTTERATMMNDFWSNNKGRERAENGDVVRAVIRLAGSWLINMMLREGGSSFTQTSDASPFDNPGPIWTEDLHEEEGWGGKDPSTPFGWCGIRCVAAEVEAPEFSDVVLEEI